MDVFANIFFVGAFLMGMGCCLFIAAGIMAVVLLDD
jgi:hypothetical protein